MKAFTDAAASIIYRIIIFIVLAFLIVPVAITVMVSLDGRDIITTFIPPSLSLKWYERLLQNAYVFEGLKTSLILAIVVSIVVTALSFIAAIGLYRASTSIRGSVESLLTAPLLVPNIVLGFGLLLVLSLVGISDPMTRLMLGHLIITAPYSVRVVFGAVFGVRKSLLEAASTLGARDIQTFKDILLPLAVPGIAASILLSFALSIEEVTLSIFLIDGRTYTFPTALFSSMRETFNPEIAAASVLLIAVALIVVVIIQKMGGLNRITDLGEASKG